MDKPLGLSKLTQDDRNFAVVQLAAWPSETSVKNLFALYHKYVALQPSNMKCSDCRRTIRSFWTNYLR